MNSQKTKDELWNRLWKEFGQLVYMESMNEHVKMGANGDLVDFISQELDRAREEGYQKGWEDGSKGKVFEKIEVETEVTFKDLRDVIEGKEDAGEFLSKLTTK